MKKIKHNKHLAACRDALLADCTEDDPCPKMKSWNDIAQYLLMNVGSDDGEMCLKLLRLCSMYETLHRTIGVAKQIELFSQERDSDALKDVDDVTDLNPRLARFFTHR